MSDSNNGGIVTDVHTTYRVEGVDDYTFLVTAHTRSEPDLLCIHGLPMPMTLYFRVDQAEDLIEKLQGGLKRIKEYHFKKDMTNKRGMRGG